MESSKAGNKKSKKRTSIRTQILALVMGSAFIALVVGTLAAVFFMQGIQKVSEGALRNQMEEQLLQLAIGSGDLADAEVQRYVSIAGLFSRYGEEIYRNPDQFRERTDNSGTENKEEPYHLHYYYSDDYVGMDSAREEGNLLANMEAVFAPLLKTEHGVVSNVLVATETGLLISYNADTPEELAGRSDHFNFQEREWYVGAKKTGRPYVTSVYRDVFNQRTMVSVSSPIRKDGKVVAVFCMDILVKNLQDKILALRIPNGSYVFMTENDGDLIADTRLPEGVEVGSRLSDGDYGDETMIANILSGSESIERTADGLYYAHSPVELAGWVLCVAIPESKVLEPLNEVKTNIRFAILDFVVFSLMFGGVLLYLTSQFTDGLVRPIRELREDVKVISSGNLDRKVEVRKNDEIGDLGEAFNRMTGDLRTYISDLTRVTAERERIGAELDVAAKIQRDMLVDEFPPFPDRKEFDLYATMRPAKEVGGDFYDFYMPDDNHLAIAIADVSGKGIPAALFMMMSMLPLRDYSMRIPSPAEVLRNVNNILCSRNDESMFVTIWLGFLDLTTGKLVCANAGHEYPMIRKPGGEYVLFKDPHSLAAGVMEGTRYKEYELQLEPGADIFVYSDGLPEGVNEQNVQFGTDGILQTLNSMGKLPMKEVLESMQRSADAFAGTAPQFDDITMLGLHWYGPASET
ncbi:MAG: SpoIIE family protein phosphatase [Clostridium sp.]|nr:SpoIIE family protein phosphatase [Clostridium sp.]